MALSTTPVAPTSTSAQPASFRPTITMRDVEARVLAARGGSIGTLERNPFAFALPQT